MICPKCQTENPEGSNFCVACGSLLTPSTQPTRAPQPQTQVSPPPPTKAASKPWWETWWKILLILLFTGPLGLIGTWLVWAKTNWNKTIKWFVTGIIVLIVLTANIYLGVSLARIKQPPKQPKIQPEEFQPYLLPTQKPELSPTPTPTPISLPPVTPIQTVGTEFKGVSALLTSVSRSGGVVTVRFTLKASDDPKEMHSEYSGTKIGYTYQGPPGKICLAGCYEWAINSNDTPYSVTSAFLVDETNQMKYEVLKDPSGNYLASKDVLQMLKPGQSISLYAQFAAPPETTKTVTINFPKIQPFTGVPLE